ncbi:hypothetical protein F5884DRAFT_753930 [Xylogone sp. PMI_703]|nr:hypothetical protein F5884DRAFT_753930 [Xylogone sp. PMI_703]
MSAGRLVIFSGGSAANKLVDVFGKVAQHNGCSLSYVIPISDNGGSSSELIRVFGGPGIGDVRSKIDTSLWDYYIILFLIYPVSEKRRLVRLIPADPTGKDLEKNAIQELFNHRLSSNSSQARIEWLDIVEARHRLWTNITSSKRELIRSFLNALNLEIVKRARPSSVFNFQSASVGNLFLTGARLFTGSFESSIYLFGAITGVPEKVNVIPAINSNFSHHISAGLEDGTVITGQNSISHPSSPSEPTITTPNSIGSLSNPLLMGMSQNSLPTQLGGAPEDLSLHDAVEDANLPGSLPALRKQYINFAKIFTADLPSRISRIWYINPYGQEIRPAPNQAVLQSLNEASSIIYSIGSLYTSIIPCLILREVGSAIASRTVTKVLILNGTTDRETRAVGMKFGASEFVRAIVDACDSSRGMMGRCTDYVTHVIHLHGEGTPEVQKEELIEMGVKTIRIYGKKTESSDGEKGMVYDGVALEQTLEAILGRSELKGDKTRRNTFESVYYLHP